MRSLLRNPWVIVGGIVVAAVAFYLFRPDTLFVDDAVDESLDDAFTAATVEDEPSVSSTVDEEAMDDDMDEGPMDDDMDEESMDEETAESSTTSTTVPTGPVAEATGSFYGINHSASGTATIYEQDGARVLRFEDDTDIQNGPDLYVWLLPTADYDGGDPEEYIDLGRLKGNLGGQNYELPDDFVPGEWTVLIWCLRFTEPFAAAPLV